MIPLGTCGQDPYAIRCSHHIKIKITLAAAGIPLTGFLSLYSMNMDPIASTAFLVGLSRELGSQIPSFYKSHDV